jgi:hypothetical protein
MACDCHDWPLRSLAAKPEEFIGSHGEQHDFQPIAIEIVTFQEQRSVPELFSHRTDNKW